MKLARVTYKDPGTRMTEFVRSTSPDQISVFECSSLNEFNSAKTTAYSVKSETREDGYRYCVSLDHTHMRVSVRLIK